MTTQRRAETMDENRRRLILFTRYPIPGQAKTRLIPALGAQGAAALYRRLVLHTLRTVRKSCRSAAADLEVHFEGGTEQTMSHWLGDNGRYIAQGGGDLGDRMARAFEGSFCTGSIATVLIGSDCPGLSAEIITTAFELLRETPVVLGP